MRPLRICIFSSTSFGDTFGNHLWKELPQIAQTEKHKLDFSRRFCLGSFRSSCDVYQNSPRNGNVLSSSIHFPTNFSDTKRRIHVNVFSVKTFAGDGLWSQSIHWNKEILQKPHPPKHTLEAKFSKVLHM